jgi:cation transport ATPase
MPRKERSIESRVKEHRKYREQCRRRIRPSIILSAIILAILGLWAVFLRLNVWIAIAIVAFTAFSLSQEIIGFRYHSRKLRELGFADEEKKV